MKTERLSAECYVLLDDDFETVIVELHKGLCGFWWASLPDSRKRIAKFRTVKGAFNHYKNKKDMTLEEKQQLAGEAYEWQKQVYRNADDKEEAIKNRNRCATYATGNNVGRMTNSTFAKFINKYHPSKKIEMVLKVKRKTKAERGAK